MQTRPFAKLKDTERPKQCKASRDKGGLERKKQEKKSTRYGAPAITIGGRLIPYQPI
jgi:hypothetical protein